MQRGFLNSSLAGQVSPKVSVMSLKTLVAKEEEVIRAPPLLDRCVSPKVDKGEDLRMNSLIESQKWPIDFGSSGEVVVRDQGVEVWDGVDGASRCKHVF